MILQPVLWRWGLLASLLVPSALGGQAKPAPKPAPPLTAEQQVLQAERSWSRAIVRHNIDAIAELLADDYIRTSPDGQVHNRSQAILEFGRDTDRYTASTFDDAQIRIFGDVGLVQAAGVDRGTGVDGKAFLRRYRYTDVWVRRGGGWKCVASHASEVLPAK